MAQVTRLGLYGGPRAPYAGFQQARIAGTGTLNAQSSQINGTATVSGLKVVGRAYANDEPFIRTLEPIRARGRLRASRATINGTGTISWNDFNKLALLIMAA